MNVFELDSQDKFSCFDNFFKNKLLMCSDYFSSPFSSFILSNYTSMLVKQEDESFKPEKHIIFDNSLSKKDIGLFEKGDVALNTDLLFKLKNFEDYKTQAGAGKLFLLTLVKTTFYLVTAILVSVALWQIFTLWKLKRISQKEYDED